MKNSIDLRKNKNNSNSKNTAIFFLKVSAIKLIVFISIFLLASASYGQSKIKDVPQTKKIVSIEYGVTCGKTGKPAVYVYFKQKTASGFNAQTDREIVYTENLVLLQKTIQYQSYIKSI